MKIEVTDKAVAVQVFQATLVFQEQSVKLTKAVAKQFPVLKPFSVRFDAMAEAVRDGTPSEEALPSAYLKVNAKSIDKDALGSWYLLVDHPDGGLAWASPVHPESYVARKGWPHDDLASIPTVIL